jgi:hypothetical protein
MATGNEYTSRACPTGPDYFARRRSEVHFRRGCHGRDQSSLCVQVGAAVSAEGAGGISGYIRPRLSSRVAPACFGGATHRARITGLRRRGRHGRGGQIHVCLLPCMWGGRATETFPEARRGRSSGEYPPFTTRAPGSVPACEPSSRGSHTIVLRTARGRHSSRSPRECIA